MVVPILTDARSRVDRDQALGFARAVSEALRDEAPDRLTTTVAKAAREGRVFLDYLRNGRMATAVAPWSVRARPGAGLACPVAWGELDSGFDPATLNFRTRAAVLARYNSSRWFPRNPPGSDRPASGPEEHGPDRLAIPRVPGCGL